MIVKDLVTKQEAFKLLQGNKKVFYSDKFYFAAEVFVSDMLDRHITSALERGEIAIVGVTQDTMELFDYELKTFKTEQRKLETKNAREWFKAHPREVQKVLKRIEAREKAVV